MRLVVASPATAHPAHTTHSSHMKRGLRCHLHIATPLEHPANTHHEPPAPGAVRAGAGVRLNAEDPSKNGLKRRTRNARPTPANAQDQAFWHIQVRPGFICRRLWQP